MSFKRRTYAALSITTTPVPLSGFVITMSSLRFSCSIALCSAFGGLDKAEYARLLSQSSINNELQACCKNLKKSPKKADMESLKKKKDEIPYNK